MFHKKQFFSTLFSISLLVFFNTSCVKKDPISKISQVLFVPLSPNASSCDFSLNGTLYATSVGYSTTVGTLRYTLPYFIVEPRANNTFSYNATGSSNAFASTTKDLLDENAYSSFLIDSVNKAKVVVVNDDLREPTPGKVKIRFFHFSPNTIPIDVVIQGTTTKLFTNRSFNDQATNTSLENFIEITPGVYTFLFNNAATGATLYTVAVQTFLPDRIYTLAARGFTGGAGNQALGAFVYPNKP